jgi:hypothetical protein
MRFFLKDVDFEAFERIEDGRWSSLWRRVSGSAEQQRQIRRSCNSIQNVF